MRSCYLWWCGLLWKILPSVLFQLLPNSPTHSRTVQRNMIFLLTVKRFDLYRGGYIGGVFFGVWKGRNGDACRCCQSRRTCFDNRWSCCHWWYLVRCNQATRYLNLNKNVGTLLILIFMCHNMVESGFALLQSLSCSVISASVI